MTVDPAYQPAFLSLPAEVVEDILVSLAEDQSPTSIADLAQSCRRFRQLVYDPLDKFLWRRVFLTTFDDPRGHTIGKLEGGFSFFDWGYEFRTRVWAASYVQYHLQANIYKHETTYRLRSKRKAVPTQAECDTFSKALHTLVRVMGTALAVNAHGMELHSLGGTLSTARLIDADARTVIWPLAVGPDQPSKNVAWLKAVLELGLPKEFNPRFSEVDVDPYWLTPDETQLVHKLVVFLGLTFDKTQPITAPIGRINPPRPRSKVARCEFVNTDRSDLTEEELVLRARFLARKKAFNVNYLSRRRAWGPFQEYHGPLQEGAVREDIDSDSDSDDPDYVPQEVVTEDEDLSEGEDEDYVLPAPVVHKPSPEPENLRADWIHLAAIRIDVQLALQEHPQWSDLKMNLMSWDGFRPGAWVPGRSVEVMEWDWAGVEGVWRRCVCWLDYSELYWHVRHGFRSADFDEACLIVPLTVRIVGYLPCVVPGYEDRPKILIEGEMGGAGWLPEGDGRRIHGTVGMIGDGSIRWSIYSSVAGQPNEDEWCSEGVQIGGVGSTCGILGVWTGAEHDPNDPIGAWWQWRVA